MWILSSHWGLEPWEDPPDHSVASCQLPHLEERHPLRKCLLFLSSCRSSYLYYCIKHLHLPHPGEYSKSQFFVNKIGCRVTGRSELRHQIGYNQKCGGATYQPRGLNKASQPWEHTFHQAAIRKMAWPMCSSSQWASLYHPRLFQLPSGCSKMCPLDVPGGTVLEKSCVFCAFLEMDDPGSHVKLHDSFLSKRNHLTLYNLGFPQAICPWNFHFIWKEVSHITPQAQTFDIISVSHEHQQTPLQIHSESRRWEGLEVGWMASSTQWTWVWANFRRQWRTGKPGVLQSGGHKESDTT